mmetsp:Transcript_87986/g.247243  ORF Transcript_87986/g.247243 Transcript_87986/m.247243 type:complete len:301 (+) Transcript_87986:239-1141(+)
MLHNDAPPAIVTEAPADAPTSPSGAMTSGLRRLGLGPRVNPMGVLATAAEPPVEVPVCGARLVLAQAAGCDSTKYPPGAVRDPVSGVSGGRQPLAAAQLEVGRINCAPAAAVELLGCVQAGRALLVPAQLEDDAAIDMPLDCATANDALPVPPQLGKAEADGGPAAAAKPHDCALDGIALLVVLFADVEDSGSTAPAATTLELVDGVHANGAPENVDGVRSGGPLEAAADPATAFPDRCALPKPIRRSGWCAVAAGLGGARPILSRMHRYVLILRNDLVARCSSALAGEASRPLLMTSMM